MLPASFLQMERFWLNIPTYVINLCVDRFTYRFNNPVGWAMEGWGIHKKEHVDRDWSYSP